jgi:hypothetical protein
MADAARSRHHGFEPGGPDSPDRILLVRPNQTAQLGIITRIANPRLATSREKSHGCGFHR